MVLVLLVTRLTTLHSSGTHDWDCPMAILLALLAVPWGDGVSVDQWRSPSPIPPDTASPRYGFALWAPGVVMGLAFAVALGLFLGFFVFQGALWLPWVGWARSSRSCRLELGDAATADRVVRAHLPVSAAGRASAAGGPSASPVHPIATSSMTMRR
jgi:hypothetical protein